MSLSADIPPFMYPVNVINQTGAVVTFTEGQNRGIIIMDRPTTIDINGTITFGFMAADSTQVSYAQFNLTADGFDGPGSLKLSGGGDQPVLGSSNTAIVISVDPVPGSRMGAPAFNVTLTQNTR